MYETVEGLFTGICDAIREKDGTTELISHQEIPARISAISGEGNREIISIPSPADEVEKMIEEAGCRYVTVDGFPYLTLRKSFSFNKNGYNGGIFKLKKPIIASYESISLTGRIGCDGGNIKTKVYIKIADSVPDAVSGVRYDFSDWILIKETNILTNNALEETINVPNDGFTGSYLYIGVEHGDEYEVYSSEFAIKSIILNM